MEPLVYVALFAVLGITTVGVTWAMVRSQRSMLAELKTAFGAMTFAVTLKTNGGRRVTDKSSITVAGSAKPYGPLSWLPVWSQNQARLADGELDPEHWNDCGECCAAMVIAAVHGTPVEPGDIRVFLGGFGRTGITDGADLEHALGNWNVAAQALTMNVVQARQALKQQWAVGMTVIVLGHWMSPNFLHWVLLSDYSSQGLYITDPWDGTKRTISWPDFDRLYFEQVVLVRAHLHYDMSKVPVPGSTG